VEVAQAAPVAAVERRVAREADGRSDRRAAVAREHDAQVRGHRRGDRVEERAVQVRGAAAPRERVLVEAEDGVPFGARELAAVEMRERDAGLGDAPPLALGLLALLGAEAAQEL